MYGNDNHIDEVELKRLGIRRVEKNVFQRGEYLYPSLHEAIAAARKDEKA